jgi:phage FluMu protein gp41
MTRLIARPHTSTVTVDLDPEPALAGQTEELVALADQVMVTTESESVEASAVLTRVQMLRRFVSGVYKTAKGPLNDAKRRLDGQEKALLAPLRRAESDIMATILAYRNAEQARLEAAAAAAVEATVEARLNGAPSLEPVLPAAPAPETLVEGMVARSTWTGTVTDLRKVVLSVAAQLLLDDSSLKMTTVTRRWLTKTCDPSPQASLDLLSISAPRLNALARALRHDLSVPGTAIAENQQLVSRK